VASVRPATAAPAAPAATPGRTGPIQKAHRGTNRRLGLLSPDTPAVCLNGHIFQSHYPEWARRRGWQGRVVLRIFVTAHGRVGRVVTVRRSEHDLLNRTAVRIARWLRFKPARRNGRAIESWIRVPVKYVIVDPD
jgi:protein TonB